MGGRKYGWLRGLTNKRATATVAGCPKKFSGPDNVCASLIAQRRYHIYVTNGVFTGASLTFLGAHHINLIPGRLARGEISNFPLELGATPEVPCPGVHLEKRRCPRSLGTKSQALAALLALLPCPAFAETPGPDFGTIKNSMQPVADAAAGFVYLVASAISFIFQNSSAAVLLSAISASVFAFYNIRNQRKITILRETYTTIKQDLWDKDFIAARLEYSRTKNELKKQNKSIAIYCKDLPDAESPPLTSYVAGNPLHQGLANIASAIAGREASESPAAEHVRRRQVLSNILNDYENLALGIRMRILDEEYLYRWMKTSLLKDWDELSPLVTAFRHERNRPSIYVEFEGLAASWRENQSYLSGKSLQPPSRKISIS